MFFFPSSWHSNKVKRGPDGHAKGLVAIAKRMGDGGALSSSPQPEQIRHHLPELLLQAEHIIARS